MVEEAALFTVLPELGPIGLAAAAILSAVALTGLYHICQSYPGSSIASSAARTVDGYTAIINDLKAQFQETPFESQKDILAFQFQQVTQEAMAKVAALSQTFIGTSFASPEALTAAYNALDTTNAHQFEISDTYMAVRRHYISELARLTTPVVTAPTLSAGGSSNIVDDIEAALASPAAPHAVPQTITPTVVTPSGVISGAPAISNPATPSDVVNPGAVDTNLGLESYLTGALPLVGTSLVAALAASAQDIGCGLQRGTYQCQDTGFASVMARVLPSIAPLGIIAFLNNPTIAKEFTDPLTKAFLDTFITMPEVQKPITPDEAPSVIRAVFSRAMGLGIGAHLASEVAESSTTLKYMGLNYIAAFLCDMAGFSKIAGATMGVVESQALGLPMRYYVNEHVRTELPRMGDLLRLAEHRAITEDEFAQLAAYQGYSDELITKYFHIAHRPAGYFMLRRMAASGLWDESYFKEALIDCGFDDPTVDHALGMLYSEAHAELKAVGTGPAMTRFKEGLDTEEALKTNLVTLGVNQDLISKYVFTAKLSADYDEYLDFKAAWTDSVRKGLSTPDDFEAALVQRGLAPTRAKLIANRERIRLYATPKKLPTPT